MIRNLFMTTAAILPVVAFALGCNSGSADSGLDLSKRVSVSGLVMLDGRPAKNAEVSFEGPIIGRTKTNGSGKFDNVELPEGTGLLPGDYDVRVFSPGTIGDASAKITIPEGGAKDLKIEIKSRKTGISGPAGGTPAPLPFH